uniref:Uncharacterized protein n=1 Tax=Cajanus cajan TaxID=3821 RepID=A0A151RPS3_CAJCA|nr:hypothetical protein KK1_033990 [Cajanus cajan]
MSTFLLPTSLEEEIQRMLNSFWWGSNQHSSHGINWLSWEKLTMRKEYGGIGFRHLHGFNLAMLRKQGWNLQSKLDALFTHVFKAKYLPQGDFLGARLGHNLSFIWRSIHTSQVLVQQGTRWCIGDGSSINLWKDPWLCHSQSPYISHLQPLMEANLSQFMTSLTMLATGGTPIVSALFLTSRMHKLFWPCCYFIYEGIMPRRARGDILKESRGMG